MNGRSWNSGVRWSNSGAMTKESIECAYQSIMRFLATDAVKVLEGHFDFAVLQLDSEYENALDHEGIPLGHKGEQVVAAQKAIRDAALLGVWE